MFAVCSDEIPAHQEALLILRSNIDFQRHLVSTAVTRLQQIAQQGRCDGSDGDNTEKLVKYCSKIGRYVDIFALCVVVL